eukprot:gene6561-7606_t
MKASLLNVINAVLKRLQLKRRPTPKAYWSCFLDKKIKDFPSLSHKNEGGANPRLELTDSTIYDHDPSLNRCFEADLDPKSDRVITGIVLDNLNDSIPVLNPKSHGSNIDPTCFKSFFTFIEDINLAVELNFQADEMPSRPGFYRFQSYNFFPIDGKGLDSQNNGIKQKLTGFFKVEGTEEFYYKGNDDAWLFINGTLTKDLGGVHSAQSFNYTTSLASKGNINK